MNAFFGNTALNLGNSFSHSAKTGRHTAQIINLSLPGAVDTSRCSPESQRQMAIQKAMLATMIAQGELILITPPKGHPNKTPYYHPAFPVTKRVTSV